MPVQTGQFLQHAATFVVGFVIAFTRSWDMTLVLVGCLPFLAGVGGILAKLVTTLTNKATAAYTEVCWLFLHSSTVSTVGGAALQYACSKGLPAIMIRWELAAFKLITLLTGLSHCSIARGRYCQHKPLQLL